MVSELLRLLKDSLIVGFRFVRIVEAVSKSTPVRLEPTGRRAEDMPPLPDSEK